jgi:hypothetical protein
MIGDYGDYAGALSNFEDFGILDDMGLGPEAKTIIPPALGVVTAYGVTALVRRFTAPGTFLSNYAGLAGAVGSLGVAYGLYRYQGRSAAITAATAGVLTGLGMWLLPKVGFGATFGSYVTEVPVPLLQAYEVEEGVPVFQQAPELLSEAPELLSEAPELLSGDDQPQVVSGWSPAFV